MTVGPRNPARRRSFTVMAGAACLPLAGAAGTRAAASGLSWRGSALGAEAEMRFADVRRDEAADAAARVQAEVARLERVFSLWRGDSELSRLNAAGRLDAPSQDLRLVLHAARRLSAATNGGFDVTVQPLWRCHAEAAAQGRAPTAADLTAARAAVDYRRLRLDDGAIAFESPGMAATLNGIAQGYITDRVAALLWRLGFRHVLVQLGETYALGAPPGRGGWRIGLPDPSGGQGRQLTLTDRAVATSLGAAHRFRADGRNHLLDPRNGRSPDVLAQVTVEADRALDADGLSTALSFLDVDAARELMRGYPGARASMYFADGRPPVELA